MLSEGLNGWGKVVDSIHEGQRGVGTTARCRRIGGWQDRRVRKTGHLDTRISFVLILIIGVMHQMHRTA